MEPVPVEVLAKSSKLHLVSPEALTITRRRQGSGFIYLDETGKQITDLEILDRFRALAVPPAYEDVRLAADARAHLQAVGRDEAGRTQYRYHTAWSEIREAQKSERLAILCEALPRVRQAVARDLRRKGLPRERVLAAVVTLIDRSHIRIGCEDYVHSGRSRGAATLLKRNVQSEGNDLVLTFRGKGGKAFSCSVRAVGLKRIYPRLVNLPGPRFFQYRDEAGVVRRITAADVNAYLHELAGETITAKDFRTLAATALAAARLADLEPAISRTARRKQLSATMSEVADQLGNTPAVVRKSYVHAKLVSAFEDGSLRKLARRSRNRSQTTKAEAIVAALFRPGR